MRASRAGLLALYLISAAILARAVVSAGEPRVRLWYLALIVAFLLVYTSAWRPGLAEWMRWVALAASSVLVLLALSVDPEEDYVTALFVVLAYQATIVLTGRARLVGVGVCVVLIGVSLMAFLGLLRGFTMALIPMAAGLVLPAYAVANQQIEASRAESERVVAELEATSERLEAYAREAELLAAMEERNRLARELHDSVSQTLFSVQLLTGSAQLLLAKDPALARSPLEQLQGLTKDALAHMRSLIADLYGGDDPRSERPDTAV